MKKFQNQEGGYIHSSNILANRTYEYHKRRKVEGGGFANASLYNMVIWNCCTSAYRIYIL